MSSVLAKALVVLGGDSSELDKVMSAAEAKMMKVGERMTAIGETLTHKVTLPIVALGGLAVHAFGEQADAIARTDAVLKASGNAAGVTADHLQTLASALEETTTYADENTQSAMGMLLAFQNVRNEAGKGNDVFDRTVKVGQDLAELMGKDLQAAFLGLAKTMEDPETGMAMLRRSGVVLSAQVKEQIKVLTEHGQVLEAQKLVLSEVEKRVGGLAQAMAQTPLGQFKQAWNEVNNAMEAAGGTIFNFIAPAIGLVKGWAKDFINLDESTRRIIVVMLGLAAAIGPLLIVIGTAIKVWALLSVTFGAALIPIGLAILAVGALGLAGYELVKNWTAVKLQMLSVWTFIKDTFYTSIDAVLGAVQYLMTGLGGLGDLMKGIPGPMGVFGTALSFLSKPLKAGAEGIQGLRDGLSVLAEDSLAKAGKQMAVLQNELDKTDVKVKKVTKSLTVKPKPIPPNWLGPVLAALNELDNSLEAAKQKEAVLGTSFDETGAQAAAYSTAIDAIQKTHVGMNTVLDSSGKTLTGLMQKYQQLQEAAVMNNLSLSLQDADNQAQILGRQFDRTGARAAAYDSAVSSLVAMHLSLDTVLDKTGLTLGQLIEKMQSEKVAQVAQDLSDSLKGVSDQASILGGEYDAASARASAYQGAVQSLIAAHISLDTVVTATGETLADLIKKMEELQQAAELSAAFRKTFTDLGDYVVEFAFGAKQSFGDFVRTALLDLTKLIVKMLILRALKDAFNPEKGGFLGGVGKLLGFADGGFLPPGQIGMVGERGPELVMAGNNGMRITPLPAMRAASPADAGSGGGMRVEINVNAIDSRGVNEFFEQNEGLVAGAMMRAQQRSSALRRRLGG